MIDDEDIKTKLLILFILDKYEMPIPEQILIQICSQDNNWVPYFVMPQTIEELINNHMAYARNDSTIKDRYVEITEDGKVCLSLFYSKIYKSLRDDISSYIRKNKLQYRKKQEFISNYTQNANGTYTVVCSVLNGVQTLFEFKFIVPTKSKALSMSKKWPDKAPELYKIYSDMIID